MISEFGGSVEYRVVLARPKSSRIVAHRRGDEYVLPQIEIPRHTRSAQQLQTMIQAELGLKVYIVDLVSDEECLQRQAIAELLDAEGQWDGTGTPLAQIDVAELPEEERSAIAALLERNTSYGICRVGWIGEALSWIEGATGKRLEPAIRQMNAGNGFALAQVWSNDGTGYWIKATGEPNRHELPITSWLSQKFPDYLPRLIDVRPEWNAWLVEDAGEACLDLPSAATLRDAAQRFATLQLESIGCTCELLALGAADLRTDTLRKNIDGVVRYLSGAMERQESSKGPRLGSDRLVEIGAALQKACRYVESLGVPDTLLHNDLNTGNILRSEERYAFIDWSEAAVGHPFLCCERLTRLNSAAAEEVAAAYEEIWSRSVDPDTIRRSLGAMRLLSIYAYLVGRGDWLSHPERITPRFESYMRSLARHMDRAAQNPLVQEAVCH